MKAGQVTGRESNGVLGTPATTKAGIPENQLENITRFAALLLDVPICLVIQAGNTRGAGEANGVSGSMATESASAFCNYALQLEVGALVTDTLVDERFHTYHQGGSAPVFRFYAAYPLCNEAGNNTGALCIVDYLPRTMDNCQLFVLETLAGQVQQLLYPCDGQPARGYSNTSRLPLSIENNPSGKTVTDDQLNREHLEFAMEGWGVGSWNWDMQNDKVFYSNQWKTMLGYTLTDMDDTLAAWKKLIHSEDIENVNHELDIHISGAMPFYQCEHRLLRKNGQYTWVLDRGMIIARDINGQPVRMVGAHTDISQLKYTELALEQRLKQFKSLAGNLPGVLYEYEFREDGTEGLRYVSPAMEKIFGIPPVDFYNYTQFIHPDDRALIAEKIVHSCNTLQPFYCEARLVVPGRCLAWYSVTTSFSYIADNGAKIFTGFMMNITERKNTEENIKLKEEKYRRIIANMNLGLLEVDISEKILFANQSFCDMSGYDVEELIQRSPADIFILGDNRQLMSGKNEDRKRGLSDAYEIAVVNKRGQARWWLISGAPMFDETGNVTGSIGIHFDITRQKKLEADLTEAREEAEASTRSKEIFLANMSHEIRTPMNAIVGMANQLNKTNLDSQQQFFIDTISSASENLLYIINDILDLSKIEAGKLQVENIGFHPAEVINRTFKVMSMRAEEKGLVITKNVNDPAIAPVLLGDPFRINQVLLNLVSNAIKFTGKGTVDISCAVVKDRLHSQLLRISVTDTGIGMEASFVKKLFEKFSQEDASITRQYGGTGLGMAITRDLVQLMGGQLQVSSTKGIGTTISFIIEFQKGIPADLPEKEEQKIDAGILKNKRVLVVDDNMMNRLVAATILKNYGAVITESVNGKEAIDILVKDSVDLVLMDIQMPVMDGVEATGFIRQRISKVLPVIALTANAIKGDSEKYVEAGMSDYLSKPYQEKDLVTMVAFWLQMAATLQAGETPVVLTDKSPLFDLSGIKQLGRGEEAFVKRMVQLFIQQTPGDVTSMIKHYQQGNLKAMGEQAHRVKPVIKYLGILSLTGAIATIEKCGKSCINDPSLPVLLESVSVTVQQVAASLHSMYQV